jgi:hypothetical protein
MHLDILFDVLQVLDTLKNFKYGKGGRLILYQDIVRTCISGYYAQTWIPELYNVTYNFS